MTLRARMQQRDYHLIFLKRIGETGYVKVYKTII